MGIGKKLLIKPMSLLVLAILLTPAAKGQTISLGEALNATNLSWVTSGGAPWVGETNISHDGVSAAQSNTSGTQSKLTTTLNGPGTLTFWWMFGLPNFTFGNLIFSVNSGFQFVLNFATPWEQKTVYLGAGTQVVDWTYLKFSGLCTGWVDQVTFTPGGTAPLVTAAPAGQTNGAGADITYNATVVGTPPLSYSWEFNGVDIPSATNPTLVLTNAQASNIGTYTLTTSNNFGTTNVSAFLSVTSTAPSLRIQPADLALPTRANALFQTDARGSAPLSYQWRFNSNSIPLGTNFALSIPALQVSNSGYYQVVVTNAYGTAASSNVFLVVGQRVVMTWGGNTYGQTNVPRSLTNAVAISAGEYHSLALNPDGTVIGWGAGTNDIQNTPNVGEAAPPADLTNAVAIAAGKWHSLAARRDGTVIGWGFYSFPQMAIPPGLGNVVSVAAGDFHDLALRSDGTVVAWGHNTSGQTNVPPGLSNVVAIAAAGDTSAALKADGTVTAWGDSYAGANNVPPGLSNIVAIAMGQGFGLALTVDGRVAGWGGNNGSSSTNAPASVTNAVATSAGVFDGMALTQDPRVVVWAGGYDQSAIPTTITNPVAVASGREHAVALLNDGSPFIARQPINQVTLSGATTWLSLGAVGTVPLAYQWQLNGTNVPGATSSRLAITNVPLTASGSYLCVISNIYGYVTSTPAFLTIQRSVPRFDASSAKFSSNDKGFEVNLAGLSGHGEVIVYASTNMVFWEPIYTNGPVVGVLRFGDPVATNAVRRFYRALEK